MTYQLEVAIVPVVDLDRARDFYVDKLGFALDVDYRPTDDFAVIQLTPQGPPVRSSSNGQLPR